MAALDAGAKAAHAQAMKLSRRHMIVTAAATLLPCVPGLADTIPPVIVADIRFDANDPAAVVQPAGPDTTRIFLRKGPWAVIWYLQAKSPVDGKPFDVVVVERQRWVNLTTTRNAVNYSAQAFGKTIALKGHGDFQRWVVPSRPWPLSDRTLDAWNAKGWLLPWGTGPKLKTPSRWPWMAEVPAYTPLSNCSLTFAMGTTGLRDDIGPILHNHALYLIERRPELRATVMAHGQAAASIPWHVRGADGAPVLFDQPGNKISLQQYYQNLPPEQVIGVSAGMQGDWQIDNAHRPNPAFVAALLSGLHPFFVEEQIFSACAALNACQTRGPAGLWLDCAQGRDWCWSMRDVMLAHALLSRLPPLPWLPAPARFDAILKTNLDKALGELALPGAGQLGIFWVRGAGDAPTNPTFWAARQTGNAPGLYQGAIPDFIGYILDWGRRLNGDPRWLKLQVQFAERFQARRALALGAYVAQPVPIRLAGRWAANWHDTARWLKVPDPARAPRWHQFGLPVNDKNVYSYSTEYPINLYHSLKLAAATGQAGANVAAAITYLERQMEPAAPEAWPAFALHHGP
jgi:hypothetical protein